jgi:pyruvate/2-oxoglutarate dehydrogenase complex dihydrolipoamide dehydrogenase (E3) component
LPPVSQYVVPSIEGLNDTGFISNVEVVALPALPHSLAVVGGGAIGIEFAQMFRRFGVDVTVVEQGPRILDKEDHELVDALRDLLVAAGKRALRFSAWSELASASLSPFGVAMAG